MLAITRNNSYLDGSLMKGLFFFPKHFFGGIVNIHTKAHIFNIYTLIRFFLIILTISKYTGQ